VTCAEQARSCGEPANISVCGSGLSWPLHVVARGITTPMAVHGPLPGEVQPPRTYDEPINTAVPKLFTQLRCLERRSSAPRSGLCGPCQEFFTIPGCLCQCSMYDPESRVVLTRLPELRGRTRPMLTAPALRGCDPRRRPAASSIKHGLRGVPLNVPPQIAGATGNWAAPTLLQVLP